MGFVYDFITGKITFEEANKQLIETKEQNVVYESCKETIYNIHCLDEYDFSEFLSDGRSLYNIIDAIEEKYEKQFREKNGIYIFDNLSIDEIQEYLISRYNIHFQEYSDWVVRHDDGAYTKARKRIKDCS